MANPDKGVWSAARAALALFGLLVAAAAVGSGTLIEQLPQHWRGEQVLTGTPRQTRQLARQLGFDFWTYDTHVMHDPRIVVFDRLGLLSASEGLATADWPALP